MGPFSPEKLRPEFLAGVEAVTSLRPKSAATAGGGKLRPYVPPASIRSKALRFLVFQNQPPQRPFGSIVQPISAGAGALPQCPPGSIPHPISAEAGAPPQCPLASMPQPMVHLGSCAQKPLGSIPQPIAAQIERIQVNNPSPEPRVRVPAEAVGGAASSRARTRGMKRAMRILQGAKHGAGSSGPRDDSAKGFTELCRPEDHAASVDRSGSLTMDEKKDAPSAAIVRVGRALAGLSQGELAERASIHPSQRAFADRDLPLDAALVGLEEAALLLSEGRGAEVRSMVFEMRKTFESEQLHREAHVALKLFLDAAVQETATAALARQAARGLAKRPRRVAATVE